MIFDWDPGVNGNRLDLYHYDKIGGGWNHKEELESRVLEGKHGFDGIQNRRGLQWAEIFTRSEEEIWFTEYQLRDLRGMRLTFLILGSSLINLADSEITSLYHAGRVLDIGIWYWNYDGILGDLIMIILRGCGISRIIQILDSVCDKLYRYGFNDWVFGNIFFCFGIGYKRRRVFLSFFIVSNYLLFLLGIVISLFLVLFTMSQGYFVGKEGAMKTGEVARKRLKISVPHFDNSELIKSYALTLVGRCMNPDEQEINSLLVMLPKIWKVEERVTGADLGMGKFQFHFEKEEDIETVLEMQPYHFDFWMLSLARWQPRMPKNFPSEIPFWIKVEGVPLEFWSTATFQSIGDAIGETTDVDLDYGKMRVVIDGAKELCFDTTVDFKGGEFYEEEEAPVLLKYEKLFGFCKRCFKLCHDEDICPLNPNPVKKKEAKADLESRKEDRARSYKGVVINGDGSNQENLKDQRGYHGKGKGKMYEEPENQWVKVPERGSKRPSTYRNGSRGEEEKSRYRNSRWEQPRHHMQEDRNRYQRDARRARNHIDGERGEPREEGEVGGVARVQRGLRNVEKPTLSLVTQVATRESNGKTNSIDASAIAMEKEGELVEKMETSKMVTSLDKTEEVMGHGVGDDVTETMKFNGSEIDVKGKEEATADEDEFQALTDGEVETVQEDTRDPMDVENEQGGIGDQRVQAEDDEKKKGTRKALFKKTTAIAVGTSKMRFVQAVLSPRKNAHAKPGKRQGGGDGARQTEDKGPLNPKPSSSKPFN